MLSIRNVWAFLNLCLCNCADRKSCDAFESCNVIMTMYLISCTALPFTTL